MPSNKPDHVAILMAVYDGADNLQAQLDSIAAQSHDNWQILASDDGSSDESRKILERFASADHALSCFEGPGQGGTANFMSLILRLGRNAPGDCFLAFSDQDDIWLPDRLERGIRALRKVSPSQPSLFCSRTWITDSALQGRRLSPARPRPLGFRNALVQNIASGNTILLNPAAVELICAAASEAGDVVVHDWWVYQIVTGAGGTVVHDDTPTLLYRQHGANQIGANDTALARLHRILRLLRGDFQKWNDVNIAALKRSAHRLTSENRAVLDAFSRMRDSHLPGRLLRLSRLGLYRQSLVSTASLWVAAILNRL